MTYTLILTTGERRAFDWVGDRYATGDEMSRLIREGMPSDREQGDSDPIKFTVPEHVAWQIRDLADEEDNLWPCFAPELATKMQTFCNKIV